MLSPPFDGAQICSNLSCIQHLLVYQLTANNYTCMTLVKECGRDEKEKKKASCRWFDPVRVSDKADTVGNFYCCTTTSFKFVTHYRMAER